MLEIAVRAYKDSLNKTDVRIEVFFFLYFTLKKTNSFISNSHYRYSTSELHAKFDACFQTSNFACIEH
jgi:hypothetical protein